jgi:hypothetical protein
MNNFKAIYGQWETMDALKDDLNTFLPMDKQVDMNLVYSWKRRDTCPLHYCRFLVAAAHLRGFDDVTPELLLMLGARKVCLPGLTAGEICLTN